MNKQSIHSGQVALIMVLIMTVVSAVAVSLASRTTVETRIQQMNVENTEALLAAQAGLEESIAKNLPVSGSLGQGKDYQVSLVDTGSTGIESQKVNQGETFEVDLGGATGVTGATIYWRPAVAGTRPAIFITDVRGTQNVDYAYDSEGSGGFTQVSGGGTFQGVNYDYATPISIPVTASSQKLRITVLGSAAFLGISPAGGLFPSQFTNYRSVADVVSSNQSSVKYGIEYIESKTDQIPPVFDYVLFSGGSIIQ